MHELRIIAFLLLASVATGLSHARAEEQPPFAAVDPNEPPIAWPAPGEDDSAQAKEFLRAPGRSSPGYLQTAAYSLWRSDDADSADMLFVLSKLRKGIVEEACGTPEWSDFAAPGDRYTTALQEMVLYYQHERPISFLNRAVNAALKTDNEAPYAFRPDEDWCSRAFDAEPVMVSNKWGSEQKTARYREQERAVWKSARLRDPKAFQNARRNQSEKLKSALVSVDFAASQSRARGLAAFALGAPGNAGTPAAQRFLALFRPADAISPLPPDDLLGGFLGIAPDASAVLFDDSPDKLVLRRRSGENFVLPRPSTPFQSALSPTLVVAGLAFDLCLGKATACGLPVMNFTVFRESEAGTDTFSIDVPQLRSDLRWTGYLSQISENGVLALVQASAKLPPSAERRRPFEQERKEFFVIDLNRRAIVAHLAPEMAADFFDRYSDLFRLLNSEDGHLVLAKYENDNVTGIAVVKRYDLSAKSMTRSEFAISDGVRGFSRSTDLLAQGIDISGPMKSCLHDASKLEPPICIVRARTNDGKFWLVERQVIQRRPELLAIRADNLAIEGALTLLDPYTSPTGGSYAHQADTFLLYFGPDAQFYEYRGKGR